MRRLTATVASLVMLLGVASYATAKGGVPAGGCQKKINLVASPAGKAIAARGTAAVRTTAKIGFVQQNFEVAMRAAVADSTTFMVFANRLPAGPVDPANGFPTYYQDSTALALAQCLDPVCAGPAFLTTLPNPALPVHFPDNFPVEMFYSRAIAKTTVGAVSVLYTAAVEGTFLNGVVAAGNQMVFSRVRVRVAGLQPGGVYTVTHPYGVKTFTADGLGVINDTVTIGAIPVGLVPTAFSLALTGNVGPFLRFASGPVPPPAGTIGNPVAPQTVTGSNCGQNFFRIAGPGLPLGAIQTNLFTTI